MAKQLNENKIKSKHWVFFRIFSSSLVLVIAVILTNKLNQKLIIKNENLRYWGISINNWNPNGNLRTMDRVFKKLGYKFVNALNGDDWDILWCIQNPFQSYNQSTVYDPLRKMNFKLRQDQRINHFPGIYWITNKANLGTMTQSKYLLPTFNFPQRIPQFKDYIVKNPNAKFVEKFIDNRGVKQISLEEINFEASQKIYQVFMDNPFLIDGHFFDFGVYVLITSIDPLRVYRYSHDTFIRFCSEKYHPFDPQNKRKYVIDDDHIHNYEHPSLKGLLFTYEPSYIKIIERIIRKEGFDVEKFWEKIDDAITEIIIKNEPRINQVIQTEFPNSTNFFELVRFDFVFDANLNPYIMEVNLSPLVTPLPGHEINAPYFEQLIFNTLRLIGAGSYFDFMSRISNDTTISNLKNIATNLEECVELNCADNCDKIECKVCLPCANDFLRFQMQESYREHSRRGNFKRIFPTLVHFNQTKLLNFLSPNNLVMMKWFEAQCEYDKNWC